MTDAIIRLGKVFKWGNGAAVNIGAAVDAVSKRLPQVTMGDLLARFDPEKHRHEIAFDTPPSGTETR